MGKPKLDPRDLDHNIELFNAWSESRACPSCNHSTIQIRKVGNFGPTSRIHECYPNNSMYFKFHCGKCQTSWHNKQLQ